MQILIVGIGKVGYALAEALSAEKQNVTIVDIDEAVTERCANTLDVGFVTGNGATRKTLTTAGIEKADILIATTASDEVNMLCCTIAKTMHNVGRNLFTIARIRDPEYADSITSLKEHLGVDMPINPEQETAKEIVRLMRYPFASGVERFANGNVEMFQFRVNEGDILVGCPLKELFARNKDMPKVKFAGIEREGTVLIPNGDTVIKPDDHLIVCGLKTMIGDFFAYIHREPIQVKSVLITGGSRIAYYLADEVTARTSIQILELSEKRVSALRTVMKANVEVFMEDGTSHEVLDDHDLDKKDLFVALTGNDEENLLAGLYARHVGTRKVIVKNNRAIYNSLLGELRLDSIVSPLQITTSLILRKVRSRVSGDEENLLAVYRLFDGQLEAVTLVAKDDRAPYLGKPLREFRDLRLDNTMVAIIVREGSVILADGATSIQLGDNVLVVTTRKGVARLSEVLRG